MLKHIVWWTMKDEAEGATGAENAARIKALLDPLMGRIPSLKGLEVSTTFLGTTTEPVQVILVSTHDDAEGLKDYAAHPEHMQCVEFIKKTVASRKAIDYFT